MLQSEFRTREDPGGCKGDLKVFDSFLKEMQILMLPLCVYTEGN